MARAGARSRHSRLTTLVVPAQAGTQRLPVKETLGFRLRGNEPTVGIDPQSRRNILDNVKELNAQGMTVLYTTHYMEEAAELSNHIAIMDKGKVIAYGTHDELIKMVGEQTRIDITLNAEAGKMLEAWRATEGVSKMDSLDGHLQGHFL